MSVVIIPSIWIFAVTIVLIAFVLFLGALLIVFFERKEEELKSEREKMRLEERKAARREVYNETDTLVVPSWKRYSSPLDDIGSTLEHRLIKCSDGKDHYPFSLPGFEPVTPFPDFAHIPPRINKVTMRTNEWIESRDQYGFRMNEYSGLWNSVGFSVLDNYNGPWMVPKQKTGYHNIVRFKYVRPTDHRNSIASARDLRNLPEVPAPTNEMSPA